MNVYYTTAKFSPRANSNEEDRQCLSTSVEVFRNITLGFLLDPIASNILINKLDEDMKGMTINVHITRRSPKANKNKLNMNKYSTLQKSTLKIQDVDV